MVGIDSAIESIFTLQLTFAFMVTYKLNLFNDTRCDNKELLTMQKLPCLFQMYQQQRYSCWGHALNATGLTNGSRFDLV